MAGREAAVQHAECCICFDDLCSEPIAALLTSGGRRACSHYFHYECIKDMCPFVTRGYGMEMEVEEQSNAELKCPMCRAKGARIVKMPDPVKDPRGWFRLVDADHTGYLSKENVRDVVKATCNVHEGQLTAIIDRNWRQWDQNNSGGVTENELPNLLLFVRKNVAGKTVRSGPPHIATDKQGWFDYWDEDGSGELEKGEVARALIKTFERGAQSKVKEIQSSLENAWPVFDHSGSNSVSKREFLQKDGLADTIIAILQADPSFSMAAARDAEAQSPQAAPSAPPAPSTPPARGGYGSSGLHAPDPARRRAASNPNVSTNAFPSSPSAWRCPRCTFEHPTHPPHCAMCHSANPNHRAVAYPRNNMNQTTGSLTPVYSPVSPGGSSTGSPGGGRPGGSPGGAPLVRMAASGATAPTVCVVCGALGRNGEQRRSGWKCTECVGKPHRYQVRYV